MDTTEAYRLADGELRSLARLSHSQLCQFASSGPSQELVQVGPGQFDVTRAVRIVPGSPNSFDLTVSVDSPNWFKLERVEEHMRVQADP